MTTELEMFLNKLKATILDERKDALDEQQFVCGRLSALNRICEFIENYQEDHENTENNLAKTTDTATKRDVRKRMRVINVDGVCYKFKSAKEMMSYFSLDSYYNTFVHLVQNKGGRENSVEYEADALHSLLLKAGLHLDSYQASCFDGLARTVMFDKEEEKENA